MTTTVLSSPIPLYQNVPIAPQNYTPKVYFISNITRGKTTTVTTTSDNNYVIGQVVRLIIPFFSGIRQLNGKQGIVISLPASNQVEIEIVSSEYDAFTISTEPTQPQIKAIGDVNTGQQNANGPAQIITHIPGSFLDISPA